MTNMIQSAKDQVSQLTQAAYEKAAAAGLLPAGADVKATVEIPKDASHGDYASSFAMAGAKALRMAPRQIAQIIVDHLELEGSYFQKVEIAGPGFLNFTLGPKWFGEVLTAVEAQGANYGASREGGGRKVMVEFVSANPTGPMHMGNARGGVLGDTLASVLQAAGADVWREFYVNDAGNQIEKFASSLEARYLQIILGEEEPDAGKVRMGPTVKVGYLPQHVHFDHPERNLVDTLIYEQDCTAQTARNRLAAFKFRGEDVFKPVSALSGGEQSRLRLCMLMDEKINLLILDEPTNHLDIQSREWIEEAVEEYEGNLLFVSHDRYFIDRFASRIWMLEDGHITDFRGNYQEYQAARARGAAGKSASDVQVSVEKAPEPKEKKEKPKRPGGTKNLEKEVTAAERAVAKAEEQMYDLEQQIQEAAADYLKLQELYEQREALEEEILKLYGTWETLSAQLEEARG